VVEGHGHFLEILPNPAAYKKEVAVVEHEEEQNHEDLSPHVDFDQCSVSNESVTTQSTQNIHTSRGKRPETTRNMQQSSFTVNETLNTPVDHRPGIRVRNPPGNFLFSFQLI
jgi:hypothetical protein